MLNGSGSFTSSGSVAVSSDLTMGSGLTFGAPSGTVTFSAGGNAMTLGTETITAGALVIQNASTVTLNGVITDSTGTITVSNVTDVVAGSGENLVTPTLNLASSNSLGTAANNLRVLGNNGRGQHGQWRPVPYAGMGPPISPPSATGAGRGQHHHDPNAADTVTIAGPLLDRGGNIVVSAAGTITDNANINASTGTITINANTSGGNSSAGFSQTAGLIQTTNATANAILITVNTAVGSSTRTPASTTSAPTAEGTLNVNTFGGSVLYAGTNTLDQYQLGVVRATAVRRRHASFRP